MTQASFSHVASPPLPLHACVLTKKNPQVAGSRRSPSARSVEVGLRTGHPMDTPIGINY